MAKRKQNMYSFTEGLIGPDSALKQTDGASSEFLTLLRASEANTLRF